MNDLKRGLIAFLILAGIALFLELLILSFLDCMPSGEGFFVYFCFFFAGVLFFFNHLGTLWINGKRLFALY